MRPRDFRFALISTAIASTAMAQDWVTTGGPPGGAVRALASDAGQTLAGVDGGLFRSVDAGDRWAIVGDAPAGAHQIVAADGFFYVATPDVRVFRTDGAAGGFVAVPDSQRIVKIGGDADGQGLFAVASPSFAPRGQIFLSDNEGDSWALVDTLVDVTGAYRSGDVLLAATYASMEVLRSTDAGQTWTPIGTASGLPGFVLLSDFAGEGDTVLAAYTDFLGRAGIARSDDLGQTWQDARAGLLARSVLDLELGDEHVFLLARDLDGFSIDVWRSPRDGGSWTLVGDGLDEYSHAGADLTIDGDALLLATPTRGVLRSSDHGQTWHEANEGLATSTTVAIAGGQREAVQTEGRAGEMWRLAGDGWQPVAFPAALGEIRTVAAMADGTYLAGTGLGGVRLSTDGGQTWRAANTGVPRYVGLGGSQLREFDAFVARGDTWLGAGGAGAEWPPPGPKGAAAVETGGGGVIRSTDRATSWQRATAGLPIVSRAPDGTPHYPAALSLTATADGFLMGTRRHGVYRSINDGLTWTASSTGLPSSPAGGLAPIVTLAELGTDLYAATDATDVGPTLFRSTNRGVSWSPVAGLPEAPTLSLTTHEGQLFAGLGVVLSGARAGSGGGVWSTADGLAWSPVGEGLDDRMVSGLTTMGGRMLAGTIGLGVWQLEACAADLDGDGALTIFDFLAFSNLFDDGDPAADFNGDGVLDLFDYLAFQDAFDAGCD